MQTQPGVHISVMVATTALLFMTRFISPNRGMPGQLGGLELTMTHPSGETGPSSALQEDVFWSF